MEEENQIEKVTELIESKKLNSLKEYLIEINSADFPSILEAIDEEKVIMVYRLLPKEKAAEVFVELDSDDKEKLINCLTDAEIKNVMNEIYMDDAADLVEEMPSNVVKRILANTKSADRKIINELLKYPDSTAGSLMTTEFIDLKENMTVEKAFDVIKTKGAQKETVYNCYVLTIDRKLLGVLDIKNLLIADPDELIKDIMDTNVIKVNTLEDQEEVVKMFDKYDCVALPVVDKEDRLVGIITIDDAMDVMHEEVLEDFEKMAAITPNDDTYFKTSSFTHAKNRIIWLLLLMLSATITGTILAHFESVIATLPILVAFIPMLMDTGGNSGSQSSTLIIRGLATDDISTKDILKVIWKEFRVAIICGFILAFINGFRIAIQYHNSEPQSLLIALVVSISLVLVIMVAKLLGAVLPMLAKKLKLDPAIMASPIITTLVDIFAVYIYFILSTIILHV